MKVLYSQLKKYLPQLNATPKEVAETYTLTGFMIDKLIEVEYLGQKDFLLDLEVRQNRADAFGVIGLARELSAYYNIPLVLPEFNSLNEGPEDLQIEVKARDAVKRVMAVKIDNIKITNSPEWLVDYLSLYEINSINNLVDLTNYVMIETGHASHAFDFDLMENKKLIWEINSDYKNFTTLSGDGIELTPDTLVISDGTKPLSLSIIGGKEVAINSNSKNIILEMAIYDGGLVRRNSRQLRIITEASSRLEKYLDPESIPQAFSMLVNLIIEQCQGTVTSKVNDEYIQKEDKKVIQVNLDKVQQIAGIKIPYEESVNFLNRLGFATVSHYDNKLEVKRPVDRLDITLEEDIFEEIIRLNGFNKIPKDELALRVSKDITPSHIELIANLENHLVNRGFDEVRSWVLVDSQDNQNANFLEWDEIKVTNSINEEVPFLRQSIGVSLLGQLQTYLKNNIPDIKLFESGKVFGKVGNEYKEINSLGLLTKGKDLDELRSETELLFRSLGLEVISFKEAVTLPKTAHPKTAFDIFIQDKKVGMIYVTNKNIVDECCTAEINLDETNVIALNNSQKTTHEITQKLVELDANIELKDSESIDKVLIEKTSLQKNIWKNEVLDKFEINGKIRYTIRVHYMNMTDPEAKELHREIFG